MSPSHYESELRFIIIDVDELGRRLLSRNAIVVDEYLVLDEWYVPRDIRTYEDHERWLDSGSATPIRLRIRSRPRGKDIVLEIKTPAVPGNYTTVKETSMEVNDETTARHFLRELGLTEIITLQKSRSVYELTSTLSCFVDRYSDGSAILEVEAAADVTDTGVLQIS